MQLYFEGAAGDETVGRAGQGPGHPHHNKW